MCNLIHHPLVPGNELFSRANGGLEQVEGPGRAQRLHQVRCYIVEAAGAAVRSMEEVAKAC